MPDVPTENRNGQYAWGMPVLCCSAVAVVTRLPSASTISAFSVDGPEATSVWSWIREIAMRLSPGTSSGVFGMRTAIWYLTAASSLPQAASRAVAAPARMNCRRVGPTRWTVAQMLRSQTAPGLLRCRP